MANASNDSDTVSGMTRRYCTACGTRLEAGWAFCSTCGQAVHQQGAESPASNEPSDMVRRAKLAEEAHEDIVSLPGYSSASAYPNLYKRKRRRRRKRPLWRRPIFVVPMALLLIFASLAGAVVFRTSGIMSSVNAISTPPPVITDSTYMEGDDPDMPDGPIQVDTSAAQEVIAEASTTRELPQPKDSGINSRIRDLSAGVGDIAGAAAIAGGLGDNGSREGFTVLVMGVDAQPGAAIDIGVRPDVMMLVHFVPETRSCRMLSIPRDTRVELPGYGQSKINHALMVGGIPYQLLVTEDFIGHPIDHYVLIDFEAFEEAVNAVGGVEVDIDEDLERDGQIRYVAGSYQMDGEEALSYARFRTPSDDGDTGRVQRQWSLLAGLAEGAQGRDLIADVNTLVPTVEEHIRTDLTLTDMSAIAKDYGNNCLRINRDDIAMTDGTRVRFNDPILDERLYYNVVTDQTLEQRMSDLIAGPGPAGSGEPDATPAATPSASPAATPSASPEATQQRRASLAADFGGTNHARNMPIS